MIKPGQIYIFGGTNQKSRKIFIPRNRIITRSISKCLRDGKSTYSIKGSFTFAKFRRVTRNALMIRRTHRSWSPRAQRVHGIKNVLSAGFKLAKKLATNNTGRQLGKSAIGNAPWVYQAGVSQVKNKRLQKTQKFSNLIFQIVLLAWEVHMRMTNKINF